MARYNTTMKINRLEMIKSQLKLRLLNAQTDVESLIEKDLIERAQDEFKRQAGLLGRTVMNNYKDAETIARASFHGARFSTRIWGSHQTKLRKALNKALENSLILGKNVSAVIGDFRKITDSGKKQAQRLLATEVCRVQIEAQKRCYVSSGFTQYLFMANSGCCHECQSLNGKHFSVDVMEAGHNAPPMHPNCRCSTVAYMERSDDNSEFDEKDFDEWSETFDEHGLSWEDWKRKQKGEAIDFGSKLTIDDFDKISNITMSKEEKGEFVELLNKVGRNIAQAYKVVVERVNSFSKSNDDGYYKPSIKALVFGYSNHERNNRIGKYSTLAHEMGHAMSFNVKFKGATYKEAEALMKANLFGKNTIGQKGAFSDQFLKSARKDKEILAKRREDPNFYSFVKDDLSGGVQDALDGFFGDQSSRLVAWGHGNGYYNNKYSWLKKCKAHGRLKEVYKELELPCKTYREVADTCRIYDTASEIWVNIASAIVDQDESLDYVKEYLPNTYEAFMDMMERIDLEDD